VTFLSIGILAVLTVSITGYYESKEFLISQMKQDAIRLAKLTAAKLNEEIGAKEIINSLIERKQNLAEEQSLQIRKILNQLKEVLIKYVKISCIM